MAQLAAHAAEAHRFSVEEYDSLVAAGTFEDQRVELIEGVLLDMSPQGDPHAYVIRELNYLLVPALVGRAKVAPQLPFRAAEDSVPEPDLAVVELDLGPNERPSRASLIVEVADTSLRRDRDIKAPLYASAGVPEYWVVDLNTTRVLRYRDPEPDGYRTLSTHTREESLRLIAFPDVEVALAAFLPPKA